MVCLYRERSSGRPVAIKHISVQQMSREEREQSLNEARVLAMLHHPNIVACYHSFLEDDQSLAIVMEYAPGRRRRLAHGARVTRLPSQGAPCTTTCAAGDRRRCPSR